MSAKVSPRGSQEGPKITPKGFQKENEKNTKKSKKKGAKGRVRPGLARGRKERSTLQPVWNLCLSPFENHAAVIAATAVSAAAFAAAA